MPLRLRPRRIGVTLGALGAGALDARPEQQPSRAEGNRLHRREQPGQSRPGLLFGIRTRRHHTYEHAKGDEHNDGRAHGDGRRPLLVLLRRVDLRPELCARMLTLRTGTPNEHRRAARAHSRLSLVGRHLGRDGSFSQPPPDPGRFSREVWPGPPSPPATGPATPPASTAALTPEPATPSTDTDHLTGDRRTLGSTRPTSSAPVRRCPDQSGAKAWKKVGKVPNTPRPTSTMAMMKARRVS